MGIMHASLREPQVSCQRRRQSSAFLSAELPPRPLKQHTLHKQSTRQKFCLSTRKRLHSDKENCFFRGTQLLSTMPRVDRETVQRWSQIMRKYAPNQDGNGEAIS